MSNVARAKLIAAVVLTAVFGSSCLFTACSDLRVRLNLAIAGHPLATRVSTQAHPEWVREHFMATDTLWEGPRYVGSIDTVGDVHLAGPTVNRPASDGMMRQVVALVAATVSSFCLLLLGIFSLPRVVLRGRPERVGFPVIFGLSPTGRR